MLSRAIKRHVKAVLQEARLLSRTESTTVEKLEVSMNQPLSFSVFTTPTHSQYSIRYPKEGMQTPPPINLSESST